MYCPKCGAVNKDTVTLCENCGFEFIREEVSKKKEEISVETPGQKESVTETVSLQNTSAYIISEKTKKPVSHGLYQKLLAFFLWGMAVLILVLSVIGAISIFFGGSEIAEIQSVGGKTLEEAYYRELQYVYNGYGLLSLAAGFFFSSVLTFFGFHCFSKEKTVHNESVN